MLFQIALMANGIEAEVCHHAIHLVNERAVLDLRETLDGISLFRDVSRMTDMIIDKMDGVMANLSFNAVRHQCDLEEHVSAVPGSCLMVCEYAGGGNYTVQIRHQYNVEEMWYRAIDRSNLGS
jgi:hypothetical protein